MSRCAHCSEWCPGYAYNVHNRQVRLKLNMYCVCGRCGSINKVTKNGLAKATPEDVEALPVTQKERLRELQQKYSAWE